MSSASDIRAKLGSEWLLEGPVPVLGLALVVVRARRIDPAATNNELRGMSVHATESEEAWSKLSTAIQAHRPDKAPQPITYDEWAVDEMVGTYTHDVLDYELSEMRSAWDAASVLLPPGWRIAEVTTYYAGVGSGRWSAHVTAPHLYITSQHQFVGRTAYGDDPVAALLALAALLPSIDPTETL